MKTTYLLRDCWRHWSWGSSGNHHHNHYQQQQLLSLAGWFRLPGSVMLAATVEMSIRPSSAAAAAAAATAAVLQTNLVSVSPIVEVWAEQLEGVAVSPVDLHNTIHT